MRTTAAAAVLPPTRGRCGAGRERAWCQVTAFRFWTLSPGVKNCTLARLELFLRRLPVLLRMELLRRMELRFLSEFWWDSSLFCSVWIRMEGFSSSSRALHRGVFTLERTGQKPFCTALTEAEVSSESATSYFDCVSKLGVVHRVDALLLRYYGNEAMAPQDLLGDVGGAGLRGDAGCFHHSLQDDDDLQVAALQLHG